MEKNPSSVTKLLLALGFGQEKALLLCICFEPWTPALCFIFEWWQSIIKGQRQERTHTHAVSQIHCHKVTHVAIVNVEDMDLCRWLNFLHSGSVPVTAKKIKIIIERETEGRGSGEQRERERVYSTGETDEDRGHKRKRRWVNDSVLISLGRMCWRICLLWSEEWKRRRGEVGQRGSIRT